MFAGNEIKLAEITVLDFQQERSPANPRRKARVNSTPSIPLKAGCLSSPAPSKALARDKGTRVPRPNGRDSAKRLLEGMLF
jgi:hypothetical protein